MRIITAHCKRCGMHFTLPNDGVPPEFCGDCAQSILSKLSSIVPKPPDAITWERGVEILNALQGVLHGPMIK